MRPPNIRLTHGQVVTVYPTTWGQDLEANPVKIPDLSAGVTYPAIVTRQPATVTEQDGSIGSTRGYQVMIYSTTAPVVDVDWTIAWQGQYMLAAGRAISALAGAWQVDAIEYDPDPDAAGSGPYVPPVGG